jgi:hypothetical protein
MESRYIRKSPILLAFILSFVFFSWLESPKGVIRISCCSPAIAKNENSGPPDHAKAHGYRAKHTYRYYPSAQAYYDVERKMYFYLEGDNWRVSVSLPVSLQAKIGDYVTIGMDSDRPYTAFEEHRRNYPVGR